MKTDPETLDYNRAAWDKQVAEGSMWTRPVRAEVLAAARSGKWSLALISLKRVPRSWFPEDIQGTETLCLASGGGQQGPILAAVGARVTVFDNSPAQLERDRAVSEEHGLGIRTVQGDMADLSCFGEERFERTGERIIRYAIPFSEPRDLPPDQLAAGFHLVAFDECDRYESEWHGPLYGYLPAYMATCAVKPADHSKNFSGTAHTAA